MTTQDTPTTQTHRGEPLPWAIRGYIDATRKKRTPTHRRNIPAVMPARIHSILHLIGTRDA